MESDRRLRKVCPQCDTAVHARRAVCGCGHAFPSKRKAQCAASTRSVYLEGTRSRNEGHVSTPACYLLL